MLVLRRVPHTGCFQPETAISDVYTSRLPRLSMSCPVQLRTFIQAIQTAALSALPTFTLQKCCTMDE